MFKFKFSTDEEEITPDSGNSKTEDTLQWNESKEICVDEATFLNDILKQCDVQILTTEEPALQFLQPNHIIDILKDKNDLNSLPVLAADKNHSDLLSATYEGGIKIWECTWDMIHYINKNNITLKNTKILDLGCGAGMIGILCCLKGASCCYFQDYNTDVIKYFTISNVKLNLKEQINACKFYCGDWRSFADLLARDIREHDKFDFIVTTETIYNTNCYPKIHEVFEKLLKNTGIIYLGAKSYYFGVGGGISLFQDFLDSRGVFTYSICQQLNEGVKREILEIKFIKT